MSSPPWSSPPIEDLASLHRLDRDRLTLFVCGPGQGEAILVALPERGWLVLDGAGVGKRFAQLDVLARYRDEGEPVEAALLTHPHHDHYRGFVEVLDELGDDVRRVGCLALYFEDIGKSSPELELRALESRIDADSPLDHLTGGARTVLERIRDEWATDPARVLSLVSGVTIPVGTARVRARVLAPERAAAAAFLRADDLGARLGQRANELSAVVELVFGATRVVLGGDLPEVIRGGGAPAPTGWRTVCAAHGPQRAHSGLKVPHHGSKEALAPCLIARSEPGTRAWAVTPFNRRPRLPSFDSAGGVDVLLEQEPELHLSAMPRAWTARSPLPPRVGRSDIRTAQVPGVALPEVFSAPVPAGNRPGLTPDECIWALCFDDTGALVARHRARGATLVERRA